MAPNKGLLNFMQGDTHAVGILFTVWCTDDKG